MVLGIPYSIWKGAIRPPANPLILTFYLEHAVFGLIGKILHNFEGSGILCLG